MKIIYLIYKIWIGLVFWLTLILMYPFFKILLSKEKWYPIVFRLKKFWGKLIRILIFCQLEIENTGNFPKSPYIIVSNHSSYLDTVFMFNIIPDYFLFLGKGDLLKWPLFKMFFKKIDIPVIKENLRKENSAYNLACKALDKRECIAIYPEGTIPHDTPKMKRFKNGAFKMAIEKQVPIVPITWQSNYKILNDLDKIFGYSLPQKVKVKIHPTINTKGKKTEDISDLRNQVFVIVNSGLKN